MPSTLATIIADSLRRDAGVLGSRWDAQARAVAPRLQEPVEGDPAGSRGERLVRAVAGAVAGLEGHGELVRAGWALGASSHGGEQSLHYLLKELNLLSAMLLYASERALAEPEVAAAAGSAVEGVRAARSVQRAISLLTLAAAKGFTHDYLSGLRDQYRTLRHDLRNPLGTIRSAITLMEDETVPVEMRNDPRFRAMVVRNASSIDRLIGGQLSDDSILGPALARQAVSLFEVARAVRRDLRDEAEAMGCTIEVDAALPVHELDSVGVELALRALVAEALAVASQGARVRVGHDGTGKGTACVVVAIEGEARPAADEPLPRELLAEVGRWSGGGHAAGTRRRARLEFPATDAAPEPRGAAGPGARATPASAPAVAPAPGAAPAAPAPRPAPPVA